MKIVFVNPHNGLPVPATMGGAVEELLNILLIQNEKSSNPYELFYVQKYLTGEDKKYLCEKTFKYDKIVYVKNNKFRNLFYRVINKLCRIFRVKKKYSNFVPLDYDNNAYKAIKKINPNVIIFQSHIPANIKKYINRFGKEKLMYHLHVQDTQKMQINKYVHGLIAVSDFIKNDYEKFIGHVDMKNYVLRNSINEDKFSRKITSEEKVSLRGSLGFLPDDFVVIYCGRILKKKGVDKLLEAILLTPKNIKLLIMGSTGSIKNCSEPFIDNIAKIAEENSDKIKFSGYIKNSEVYKYYQIADLQVVPSMWEEAAGLVVLEGQMCGLPQIITRSGGMVEYATSETVILERDDKFVKNLAEKIIEFSNNASKLSLSKRISLENSKKYTREMYYQQFRKIIEEITDEK